MDEKEFIEMKQNQKVFARNLYEGTQHFKLLDDKVIDIREDVIKVKYALFGNGVNGVTQNIDLILKEIKEFKGNCIGAKNSTNIERQSKQIDFALKKIREHEDIVKSAKTLIRLFKWVGIGLLTLIVISIFTKAWNVGEFLAKFIK